MGGIELRAQECVVAAPPSRVCRARAPYTTCVAAAEALLDRGWGKPKQSHEAEISHHYVIEIPALSMSSAEWEASPRGDPAKCGQCRPHLGYPIWVVTTCPRPLSDELHIRSAATSLASEPGIASHGWSDHVESWGGRDRNRNGDCYFGGHGHCETKDAGRSTTQQGATTPLGGGVPAAERSSAGQQILSSELARSTDAAELRLTGPFGGSNVAANPRDRNAATQAPS
jgi:hypothetical protein